MLSLVPDLDGCRLAPGHDSGVSGFGTEAACLSVTVSQTTQPVEKRYSGRRGRRRGVEVSFLLATIRRAEGTIRANESAGDGQEGLREPLWPRSAAPAPGLEQPFQILASGDEQTDHVDLGEPTEAELAETVPRLCFSKQWLDPDAPFAHRLLVGSSLVVTPDAVQVGFVKAAGEDAAVLAAQLLEAVDGPMQLGVREGSDLGMLGAKAAFGGGDDADVVESERSDLHH